MGCARGLALSPDPLLFHDTSERVCVAWTIVPYSRALAGPSAWILDEYLWVWVYACTNVKTYVYV